MSLTEEQIKNLKPGDIVREVAWHGIEPEGLGNIYEVEAKDGTIIMLRNNPYNIALAPCFLELVQAAPDNNIDRNKDEEVVVIKTKPFKIISGWYKLAVVENNREQNTIAYFPFKSAGDPHLDDKNIAIKRAIDYCKYLNTIYESEQERQKL